MPTSKPTIPVTTPVTTNTPSIEIGDHPNNNNEEEGWTQVTLGKKKSPTKAPKWPENNPPLKRGKIRVRGKGKKWKIPTQKRGWGNRIFQYKNREKKTEKKTCTGSIAWGNGHVDKSKEEEGQRIFYNRRRGGRKNRVKAKTCHQRQFHNDNKKNNSNTTPTCHTISFLWNP